MITRRFGACGVSPVPLLPQESRAFHYNQHTANNQHRTLTQPRFKSTSNFKGVFFIIFFDMCQALVGICRISDILVKMFSDISELVYNRGKE
jgi:hypothetical protein